MWAFYSGFNGHKWTGEKIALKSDENLSDSLMYQKNAYRVLLTRARFVGAYWQLCGFNVIPTASWGDLESFSYCFTGLPEESVIAVSAMGAKKDQKSFDLWNYGINRLIIEKAPSTILIYGEQIELPEIKTPIQFLPTFVSKRFRNGK